jgi:hypothetical protein
MELLDLRNGGSDADARAHLDDCPRCRALLATVPADIALPELAGGPPVAPADAPKRHPTGSVGVRTGALWRAVGKSADFAWVVVVIGHAPREKDRVLVAPVVGEPGLATDYDLILDRSLLGYGAFADVGNTGVLLKEQLVEPLAALEEPAARVLVDLYRAVLGTAVAPKSELLGPEATDERDPRLLAAAERRLALRPLWRRADRLVDAEDGDPVGESVDDAGNTGRGLALLLDEHVSGPHAEWDRATLLETSGADGHWFDAFCSNRLDLTDRRDIDHLARVLHTLQVDWDEAKPAVACTLARSEGGSRQAEGPVMPMAARSQPGMAEDDVTEALYADESSVDRSADARQAAIAQYVADLRRALDDLE